MMLRDLLTRWRRKPEEHTAGGSLLIRGQKREDFFFGHGEMSTIQAVEEHIMKFIGPPASVIHEIMSPYIHIDVHVCPATKDRDFHVLVTSGMSDMPMTVPEGQPELRFAELALCLRSDFPLPQGREVVKGPEFWPIHWLKFLARYPHEYQTYFGWVHTFPNGDPAQPFVNGVGFCAWYFNGSVLLPSAFKCLTLSENKNINFLSVWPLYQEELTLKLDRGSDALIGQFEKFTVRDIIDPSRPNSAL